MRKLMVLFEKHETLNWLGRWKEKWKSKFRVQIQILKILRKNIICHTIKDMSGYTIFVVTISVNISQIGGTRKEMCKHFINCNILLIVPPFQQ